MKRPLKDKVRLQHMLDAAQKAVELSNGKSRKDFDADEALGFAIIRLLEIIGEAARATSDDLKDDNSDIPWKPMVGTRNRLIHGYFDIDYDVIWKIVSDDLPNLILRLKRILK